MSYTVPLPIHSAGLGFSPVSGQVHDVMSRRDKILLLGLLILTCLATGASWFILRSTLLPGAGCVAIVLLAFVYFVLSRGANVPDVHPNDPLASYAQEIHNTPTIPERNVPDPAHMKMPAEHYARMHADAIASLDESTIAYGTRVHATWGLCYAGTAALPHALQMLKSKQAEAREDAAGILAHVAKDEQAVDELLAAFDRELAKTDEATQGGKDELQALDSVLAALGALKCKKAIPSLAKLLRNEKADGDSRWNAMESLGRIVRRRFDKEPEPIAAAIDWLDAHP